MLVTPNEQWRQEVNTQLQSSMIYRELLSRRERSSAVNSLITLIDEGCYYAYERTKLVLRFMDQYTLHDSEHLFNVLKIMDRIIPADLFSQLSNLELALLVLSALFHDIGMAPDSNEVDVWLGRVEKMTAEQTRQKYKYDMYCNTNPVLQNKLRRNAAAQKHQQVVILEQHRLSEWIRKTHADRASEIIQSLRIMFVYKDQNFTTLLKKICHSHNDNAFSLLKQDSYMTPDLLIAIDEYVNVPYICIILRLADVLDFDSKRTPKVLFDHIGVKNPVSLEEWKKHRAIDGWSISTEQVTFSASSDHPAIEKSIKDFCKYIEQEIVSCFEVLRNINYGYNRRNYRELYKINIATSVETQIRIEEDEQGQPKYHYIDAYFELNHTEIIELLMGTNLYGNTSYALRELLQNALDTCRLRVIKENDWGNLHYHPRVDIKFYREDEVDILEIEDNGMGMDEEIIKKYFSNVGMSYYRSDEFYKEMAVASDKFTPISKFGIGFLSAFMVSESIEVDTARKVDKHRLSDHPLNIQIEGESGVFLAKIGTRDNPGTKIRLYLKEGHPFGTTQDTQSESKLLQLLNETVRYNPAEIVIETNQFTVTYDSEGEAIDLVLPAELESCLKIVNVPLDGFFDGISGTISCIFLISDEKIVREIKYPDQKFSNDEGREVIYSKSLVSENGAIHEISKFGITTSRLLISAKGFITMGGISINNRLFSSKNRYLEVIDQVSINWPFPVLYDIKLSGDMIINLTASRNRIIMDDTWAEFRDAFCRLVAMRLVEIFDDEERIHDLTRLLHGADEIQNYLVLYYRESVARKAEDRLPK